jgi:hypothetical protein
MRAALGIALVWMLLAALANSQTPALSLEQIVSRTAAYLVEYEQSLASVVAEERYDQLVQYYASTYGSARVTTRPISGAAAPARFDFRRWVPGMPGWRPFRDVLG